VVAFLEERRDQWSPRHGMAFSTARLEAAALRAVHDNCDVDQAMDQIRSLYDDIKKVERYFLKDQEIHVRFAEDAIDAVIDRVMTGGEGIKDIYRKLNEDFEHGLRLVRDRTGTDRFTLTREALQHPESFVSRLLRETPASSAQDPPPPAEIRSDS
jgi:hypothetical protein